MKQKRRSIKRRKLRKQKSIKRPNATDEEKVAAKAKVDEAVTTAKNAIDQTTNNVGVDAAKESGVESINQVQPAVVKRSSKSRNRQRCTS